MESLKERAQKRFQTLLDRAWSEEERAYAENPNAVGTFDLPKDRYLAYGARGLDFHLLEVEGRLANRHPRTGEKLELPPVASVAEAWKAVRPDHARHGGAMGESMESLPQGYLQGEYDLVYGWTGGRRIVDLKASGGQSPFSGEVGRQLASYALLEERLGRGEPAGLEAWFLGADAPATFPQPAAGELEELDRSIKRLIDLAGSERGFGEWDPTAFPPNPKSLPGFEPEMGNPSIWCSFCPAAPACPKSRCEKVSPGDGIDLSHERKTEANHFEGFVLGIGEMRERSSGKQTRRFSVANASGALSLTWPSHVVERLIRGGLRAGRVVKLVGLRPWTHPKSGVTLWYDTPATAVEVIAESFGEQRSDPEILGRSND
jgi:hypothetical protein